MIGKKNLHLKMFTSQSVVPRRHMELYFFVFFSSFFLPTLPTTAFVFLGVVSEFGENPSPL